MSTSSILIFQFSNASRMCTVEGPAEVRHIDMRGWMYERSGSVLRVLGDTRIHILAESSTRFELSVQRGDDLVKPSERFQSFSAAIDVAVQEANAVQAAGYRLKARHLQPGHTLVNLNPQANMHVVEVELARDNRILVRADYGNGGEPATMFYGADEDILVS